MISFFQMVDKVKAAFLLDGATAHSNGATNSDSGSHLASVQSASGSGILAGKKILWVEDDKFLSDIASKKLVLEKADLRHAIDSDAAFAILSEWIPNAIILDVMLPGMSGIDILAKIRTDRRLDNIPVIMLTNAGQDQNVDAAMKLGAKKFLTKATLTPQGIIREIASVL
jgi:CheY-like chemotaxis protein